MKRIVRLTESDLARIVKRVISEQAESDLVGKTVNLYRKKQEGQQDFAYQVKVNGVKPEGNSITVMTDKSPITLKCTDSSGAFMMGATPMFNRSLYNTIKDDYCTTMRDKSGNVKKVPDADFASLGGDMGGMA